MSNYPLATRLYVTNLQKGVLELKKELNFELSVTRYIDVSKEKVWQTITQQLEQWWCPKPWRVVLNKVEWKAGGSFTTTMHGPDGEEIRNNGLFLEVTPNQRLVFTDAVNSDWEPQQAFMIGLFELSDEGSGCRYTARARHWTEEAMKQHEQMGFSQGWGIVADQLAELAEADQN